MVINGKYIDASPTKNTFNLIKALKHWRMMNYLLCMPQCGQKKNSNNITPLKHWYDDKMLTV